MFQSLIGIIEDFDCIVSIQWFANTEFQSLIGIIEDFDYDRAKQPTRDKDEFQSLIGIIEDFDFIKSRAITAHDLKGFNP